VTGPTRDPDEDRSPRDPLIGLTREVRRIIDAEGTWALLVDDLQSTDLAVLEWSGSAAHVRHVAAALERALAGEVEYLAVRAPTGEPIAVGGIDYTKREDAGTLWQLVTHPGLRGLGVGTRLIRSAEDRIRARPRAWAVLGVEENNPRARALYLRLGYEAFGQEAESWEQETADGEIELYETTVLLLRKHL
jgi:ribosomal protein S18 acetylase RimI-like enzyme